MRLSRPDAHSRGRSSTASSAAFWRSTRSSRGSIRATTPMKIFPAVHYSMGGLWVDYERSGRRRPGGRLAARTRSRTFPDLYAIGECDYQYHGANRLGANSLLSLHLQRPDRRARASKRCSRARSKPRPSCRRRCSSRPASSIRSRHDALLKRTGGGENPYLIHQELGDVMTKAATVVRRNDQLDAAPRQGARTGRAGQEVLALGHGQLDESERRLHQGAARHVPAGHGDPEGGAAARRMPRGPLQAGVRLPRAQRDRAGRAPPRGRSSGATASRRTTPSGSSRRSPQWTGDDVGDDLRRRRHVAHSAAAAAVRPGRRGRDREGLERTQAAQESRRRTATAAAAAPAKLAAAAH